MADPWILASMILQHSEKMIPLIATQPNALPPHSAAKIIQSLYALYGRKVNINLITGNNTKEVNEINDLGEHSLRYERLKEYVACLKLMLNLKKGSKVNYKGNYYKYSDLYIEPHISLDSLPDIYLAGSSIDALNVANEYADVSVTRPGPIDEFRKKYQNKLKNMKVGIRLGIIAREKNEEAWEVAKELFPQSRIGKIKAITRSKSETIVNNQEIASFATEQEVYDRVYWMGAYLSGKNNNPYLIGSIEEVSSYLNLYIKAGVKSLLLPDLYKEEDFANIQKVMTLLEKQTNLQIF